MGTLEKIAHGDELLPGGYVERFPRGGVLKCSKSIDALKRGELTIQREEILEYVT